MSAKHKATQARRGAARVVAKHRKPKQPLGGLTEKTGLLAATGVVAAGSLGGVLTAPGGGDTPVAQDAASTPPVDSGGHASGVEGAPGARAADRPGRAATRSPGPNSTPKPTSPRPTATRPTATPGPAGTGRHRKPTPSPSRTARSGAAPAQPARTCGASFYDEPQETASGETFDPDALTAAHRTLPMGTRVRVTNLETGESVTVRINDRGPFVSGRCLDLSRAAFAHIAPLSEGVVRVRYRVL